MYIVQYSIILESTFSILASNERESRKSKCTASRRAKERSAQRTPSRAQLQSTQHEPVTQHRLYIADKGHSKEMFDE